MICDSVFGLKADTDHRRFTSLIFCSMTDEELHAEIFQTVLNEKTLQPKLKGCSDGRFTVRLRLRRH